MMDVELRVFVSENWMLNDLERRQQTLAAS